MTVFGDLYSGFMSMLIFMFVAILVISLIAAFIIMKYGKRKEEGEQGTTAQAKFLTTKIGLILGVLLLVFMSIAGMSFKAAVLVFAIIIAISLIIDLVKSAGNKKATDTVSKKTEPVKKVSQSGEGKGVLNPEDPRTAKLYEDYPFLKEKKDRKK
jgi:ABC-type transport system involved in multi-copper enzyme maturation permease subunit